MNFQEFIKAVKIGDINQAKSNFDEAYLNKQDDFGAKPIHWACLTNQIDILKWFLTMGCNVESPIANGWRPIHCASLQGHIEIVNILIDNYCEVDSKTDNGETPYDVACGTCDHSIIDSIYKEIMIKHVALAMQLTCDRDSDCDHQFCYKSLTNREIPPGQVIGRGSFGKVYKVKDSCAREFAYKSISVGSNDYKEAKYIENNINQYETMIKHDRILHYFGAIHWPNKILIFMELMEKSITEKIKSDKNGFLSLEKIKLYSKQILEGLSFLHGKKIIHRDIKGENVLLDKEDNVKLADFGLSRILKTLTIGSPKTFCGSQYHRAPEVVGETPYSYEADIWSFGIVVFEMATGAPLYQGKEHIMTDKFIKKQKIDYPKILSKEIEIFLDQIFDYDPKIRPSAKALLENDFLK